MFIHKKLMTVCCAAVLALGLAACGSSDDDTADTTPTTEMPDPTPEPMPHACDAGTSQACVDARQAELDAIGDDGTVAQFTAAQAALAAAQSALDEHNAAVAAAAARQALVDAAMCTAGTQACVDAHQALVDALDADETTTADDLAAAMANLAAAQMAKVAQDATDAAAAARQALVDAAAMCTDGTAACVAAHQALVDALTADDTTSAADLAAATAALGTVKMAKYAADAADARQALVDGATCTAGTAACLAAHDALIAAIQGELDALMADDDATQAQIRLKQAELHIATVARGPAQMALDAANAAANRQALVDAAMCTDVTDACVADHQALVDALQADLDALNADPDATNAEVEAAETALAAATTAHGTVQTALSDANEATMQAGTVNDAITAAMTAIGALTDESDADTVAAARALVVAAQTALDGADKLSSEDTTTEQARIDGLDTSVGTQETRIADAKKAADVVAATKAAATKKTEIGEVVIDGTAGLGGSGEGVAPTDGQVAGEYNLAIEYGETSITVEGATEDDDVKFMLARDFGDGRTMHTRTMEANDDGEVVTEVVIVSTDIDAPKATAFATVYDLDANPKTTGEDDYQSLGIDADNLAMIKTDGITATGAGTITVLAAVEDDDGTMDMDETVAAFETDATFDGAEGTLKCAGTTDCTVTLDADGMFTAFGAGWEFTPDPKVTVDVDDADYLHYGFWLQRTTDEDGAVTYDEVQTFAGSFAPESDNVAAVTGDATYKGGAVGVYVRETYKPSDGSVATATSGHFSADASLTATFGQVEEDGEGTIAPNLLNTLSGTIKNFELEHGGGDAWSVNLQGDIDTGDGTVTSTDGATGGGAPGAWSATFHGSVAPVDHDDDVATDNIVPHPTSVVGEFNANFGNGTAAGAFGAAR